MTLAITTQKIGKRVYLILFFSLFLGTSTLHAQPNINGNLADSVATLYQKYLNFEKEITSNANNNSNVNETLNNLEKNVTDNTTAIQQVSKETGNIRNLQKQLESTNQSMDVLSKKSTQAAQRTDKAVADLSNKINLSTNTIDLLKKSIEESTINNQKAVDAVFDRINKQDASLSSIQQKTENMDKALLQIAGATERHDAAIIGFNGQLQTLNSITETNQRQEQALQELYQKVASTDEQNRLQNLQTDVQSTKGSVTNLEKTYVELNGQVQEFNELLQSNNSAIRQLTDKNLFTQEVQLKRQQNKITSTSEFVKAADISLGTIVLSNALSDYLSDVSALNNPENQELGFSLSNEIGKIIDRTVIKGKKTVNNIKADKFLRIVDNVIRSPLTKTVTSAIPVVSSIKSVINMILGVAIRGKSISVGDIANFKLAIGDYIEHYEGLAKANQTFDSKLNSVKIRTDALKLLLKNYTIERANTLSPNTVPNNSTQPLTQIVQQYYSPDNVNRQVANIVQTHNQRGRMNFESALTDKKLNYPNYAINQARFIQDELEAISKEYIIAFEGYQKTIESVLIRSKKIGNAGKIDTKIKALRYKLGDMTKAYDNAVRIEEVKKQFRKLSMNAL